MKKLLSIFFVGITFYFQTLHGKIVETTQIKEISNEITNETLVLFNIAEVLMDTEISLGTQAWRKYLRKRVDSRLHDALTLYVFQHVSPKPVEQATAKLIRELQNEGHVVLALTSRGRNEWYSSSIVGIDLITETLLRQIDIDFSLTQLPSGFSKLNVFLSDFYHGGILYTTMAFNKGEILTQALQITGYRPSKIILIDDKLSDLQSLESTLQSLGIPFIGYAYSRTERHHSHFDPMIAHIQLDRLISSSQVLSDSEAAQIKAKFYSTTDPEEYFQTVIQKWKLMKNKSPCLN